MIKTESTALSNKKSWVPSFFILLFWALFCGTSYANEAELSTSKKDSLKASYKASDGGIPLPRLMAYTGAGLSLGLSVGSIYPLGGEEDWLLAWRGSLEYYYKPFISGGLDVMVYGGDVDNNTTVLYTRYRIHTRFHYTLVSFVDFFVSPLIWFESTNIDDIRNDLDFKDSSEVHKSSVYEDAPEQNGFAVGFESGLGIRLPLNFGIMGEFIYEIPFAGDCVYAFSFGLAYDIRAISDFLKRNTFATWLSLEFTRRGYFSSEWNSFGRFLFLGLQLSL